MKAEEPSACVTYAVEAPWDGPGDGECQNSCDNKKVPNKQKRIETKVGKIRDAGGLLDRKPANCGFVSKRIEPKPPDRGQNGRRRRRIGVLTCVVFCTHTGVGESRALVELDSHLSSSTKPDAVASYVCAGVFRHARADEKA